MKQLCDRCENRLPDLELAIVETSPGACAPVPGACTTRSSYAVTVNNSTFLLGHKWTVVGATVVSGEDSETFVIETTGTETMKFAVTCQVEDASQTASITANFSHMRASDTILAAIMETSHGTCDYLDATCVATSSYHAEVVGQREECDIDVLYDMVAGVYGIDEVSTACDVVYQWSVVGGTIVSGQGTPDIEVSTDNNYEYTPLRITLRVLDMYGEYTVTEFFQHDRYTSVVPLPTVAISQVPDMNSLYPIPVRITLEFNTAPSDFTQAHLDHDNLTGVITSLKQSSNPTIWTFWYTPVLNTEDLTNSIVVLNTWHDAEGRTASESTYSNNFEVSQQLEVLYELPSPFIAGSDPIPTGWIYDHDEAWKADLVLTTGIALIEGEGSGSWDGTNRCFMGLGSGGDLVFGLGGTWDADFSTTFETQYKMTMDYDGAGNVTLSVDDVEHATYAISLTPTLLDFYIGAWHESSHVTHHTNYDIESFKVTRVPLVQTIKADLDLTAVLSYETGYAVLENTANNMTVLLKNQDGTAYLPNTTQYPATNRVDLDGNKYIDLGQIASPYVAFDVMWVTAVGTNTFEAVLLRYFGNGLADIYRADETHDFTLAAEDTGVAYTPPTGTFKIYEGEKGLPAPISLEIWLSSYAIDENDTPTISFQFTSEPVDFTTADITVPNCTLGTLVQDVSDPTLFTMQVTGGATVDSTNVVTVGTSWEDGLGNGPVASTHSSNYTMNEPASVEILDEPSFDAKGTWNTPYGSVEILGGLLNIIAANNGDKADQHFDAAPDTSYTFKVQVTSTDGVEGRLYFRDDVSYRDSISFTTTGEKVLIFTTPATLNGGERIIIYATGGLDATFDSASLKLT